MSEIDIVRAWKDDDYRNSLTEAQRAMLPTHPIGLIELSDEDLGLVAGGAGGTGKFLSFGCSCERTLGGQGTCRVGSIGCPCNAHNVAITVGVGVFDNDAIFTTEEQHNAQQMVDDWFADPTLTDAQIEGITETANLLEATLPPEEWQTLLQTVQSIQQTGALTPEQLNDLAHAIQPVN